MAILYADKRTGAIRAALDETNRRRGKQLDFNRERGIVPRGIQKDVPDIMEGAVVRGRSRRRPARMVAERVSEYRALSPEQVMKKIKQLEKRMYRHAQDLEFEEAAALRDEIMLLRRDGLGLPDSDQALAG